LKIHTLFVLSHTATATAISASFVFAAKSGSPLHLAGATTFSILFLGLICWCTTSRIRKGLAQWEAAMSGQETAQESGSGLQEFDRATSRIAKSTERWEVIATQTRQQTHELQSMLSMLNRRGAVAAIDPTSGQLRDLLAGLGSTLQSHLEQIERGTCEIEQYAKSITDGSELQSHAVIKTTSYIEQLASTIDTVSANAASAKSAMVRNNESAESTRRLVQALIEGMKRMRAESQVCEKKLRGLCDPAHQISAIVATISDIAARTDLLALNASIESIRAGEHGRGFAIVAEEVRKLAEQAASATREISSLMDTMQIVTQESIRSVERERLQVDAELDRATVAEQAISGICATSAHDFKRVESITAASTQQLQLAQDIVLAAEQISQTAKANRSGADSVGWTTKSLSKVTPQFSAAIARLTKCGNSSATAPDDSRNRASDSSAAPKAIPMPISIAMSTSAITPFV